MSAKRFLFYVWAFPTTFVGLLAGALTLASRGRVRTRRGVLEFHGGFATALLTRCGASAMTLGHVIIGRDPFCLDWSRDHEHVHVRQVERWGPFFLPAYLLASAWVWMRGKRAYFDNPFEVEAYRISDGPSTREEDRV